VGFVADISGHRSHRIVLQALQAVTHLSHRGAASADRKSGDGAGLLTQVPHKLFKKVLERQGLRLPKDHDLAVAMIFLPGAEGTGLGHGQAPMPLETFGRRSGQANARCREILEEVLDQYGLTPLAWRAVPIDPSALGEKARKECPDIQQLLLARPPQLHEDDHFERTLYRVRRVIENRIGGAGIKNFYIPSLSHRTIVYKGLLVAPQLSRFYLDLQDPDFESALAIFHQRYSTNTFPTWFLAQPFRLLAHNGEINTLWGNENWMRAREPELTSSVWGPELRELFPIIWKEGSDSAKLDNVLELVVRSGRPLLQAMMLLIPEAYQNMPYMDQDLAGFFEYHATLMEPWDGPAAVAFSDGLVVGATLDRNGLRPARYYVTQDGLVVVASEVGVVELDPGAIIEKGRLGPGQMIAVDTRRRSFLKNDDIKRHFARRRPYKKWVRRHLVRPESSALSKLSGPEDEWTPQELLRQQKCFGYTAEDLSHLMDPMAEAGKEATGSMGDDTPLAVLSEKPRLLYSYFKQRFAQVTNPPIDPLRERLVMSLRTALGARGSLLEESEAHAKLIKFSSPILTNEELVWLRTLKDPAFQSVTLPCLFDVSEGEEALGRALEGLCAAALRAVEGGRSLLILSDRGVSAEKAPIPMLLAVSAVHHHLIDQGRRMRASILCESAEPREEHHFACLIGYGASCINPYLAFATVTHLAKSGRYGDRTAEQCRENYKAALEKGLLKIMAKMGISTISSYRGGQVFEALGLSRQLIDRYFPGTDSRIGGLGLLEIARDTLAFHRLAFAREEQPGELPDLGFFRFRKEGERHANDPEFLRALHKAVRQGDYRAHYRRAAAVVNHRAPMTLRDLLEFQSDRPAIPLDAVEPVEEIVRRFSTSAMSHGALSREAHINLAIAMNRLGAKSNTGEGGEEAERYRLRISTEEFYPGTKIRVRPGDSANCAIKQVASARFGVTPEYLQAAEELEIKIAQGSKPGEGGQLPGHKVTEEIARIRHAVAGTTLISPPPHHDVYSIEDLAQLIYDLKRANPRARVAVKLVAEAGVGKVAAGVVKAYADAVHISGHDGGTGASPWSSIKNAGVPWELGLAETQQVLMLNHLRGRVALRVDGGLKSGRDVVVAALLGAEEYGFGSAALIAQGCVMARQCHLNTCPVGVASQREELRARFPGQPEQVINYMRFIAQEAREILAMLGYHSLSEIIGRVDLLKPKAGVALPKTPHLDLRFLLTDPDPSRTEPRRRVAPRNDPTDDVRLDEELLKLEGLRQAIEQGTHFTHHVSIKNVHRSVGATISGEIARRYGNAGLPGQALPEGTVELRFTGHAGQSFGAFLLKGLRLILEGDAQDYVGKGMGGGEIILFPPRGSKFQSHCNVIMGNTILYGATGGFLFAAGCAGERFAVRNSGATAVVEGVGDHGCEYMTGGTVVVLGPTGRNFGAGMSGGIAYVFDEDGHFQRRFNPSMVSIKRISSDEEAIRLRSLIERHCRWTQSPRAEAILENWDFYLPLFWKVVPRCSEEVGVSETHLPPLALRHRLRVLVRHSALRWAASFRR